jgi:hypothetical protein
MALPANIGTGTIKGHIVDSVGNPITGTLTFTPNFTALVDAGDVPDPTIILPKAVVASLDGTGHFTVTVQATDDEDATPVNWTYTMSSTLTGATLPTKSFAVPQGTTVDIATVVPVSATGGTIINASSAIVVNPTNVSGLADGTLIVRTE